MHRCLKGHYLILSPVHDEPVLTMVAEGQQFLGTLPDFPWMDSGRSPDGSLGEMFD